MQSCIICACLPPNQKRDCDGDFTVANNKNANDCLHFIRNVYTSVLSLCCSFRCTSQRYVRHRLFFNLLLCRHIAQWHVLSLWFHRCIICQQWDTSDGLAVSQKQSVQTMLLSPWAALSLFPDMLYVVYPHDNIEGQVKACGLIGCYFVDLSTVILCCLLKLYFAFKKKKKRFS